MQEDKKVPQGLIFDDVFAFAGGRRDPTAMPNASKSTVHQDELKNVTPKNLYSWSYHLRSLKMQKNNQEDKETFRHRAIRNYAEIIMEEFNERQTAKGGFSGFEEFIKTNLEDFYEDVLELEGIKWERIEEVSKNEKR